MRKLLWVALAVVAVGGIYAVSTRALAQEKAAAAGESGIDPAFEQDIRKLLKITHAEANARQAMQQIVERFKEAMPQVKADYWDKFLAGVDWAEFTDLLVPIYARHLTQEDVKGLIEFHQSELGRKWLDAQPGIGKDSMAAGMTWGRKMTERLMKELGKAE